MPCHSCLGKSRLEVSQTSPAALDAAIKTHQPVSATETFGKRASGTGVEAKESMSSGTLVQLIRLPKLFFCFTNPKLDQTTPS